MSDQDTGILPYFPFLQTPDNDVSHLETRLQILPRPCDTILVQLQAQYPHPLHTLPLSLHADVVVTASCFFHSATIPSVLFSYTNNTSCKQLLLIIMPVSPLPFLF